LAFAGDVAFTAGREGKRGGSRSRPPAAWNFLRRRVNPCTASDGGTWNKRVATVPALPEASQHCSRDLEASSTVPDSILGPLFVNLNCLMCCLDYF